MDERIQAIHEMLGEYDEERDLATSRLDQHRLRRARLELAREVLVEHGEAAEADQLLGQIHDLDHHIEATEQYLARINRLIAIYQDTLAKLQSAMPQR